MSALASRKPASFPRTQKGIHVAIIMDGNGRWGVARGLPRAAGHSAGARTVNTIVQSAPSAGVSILTLYAFSSDNWQRPTAEVAALMELFHRYLRRETSTCVERGVRLRIIGRRDRLTPALLQAIETAESATAGGTTLMLRIAIDYSARDAIVRAAARIPGHSAASRESFATALARENHEGEPVPDVDLLIRTGGEQRLSDFLLWECAYAELHFSARMWPDFSTADLVDAVRDFHGRERRFGRLLEVAG
jgi:undecaprenyl diphosphate synthase